MMKGVFKGFLEDTGWRLADMTPRKLSLDAGFMLQLRKFLNWRDIKDPSLAELHPSLGNLDHTVRILNKLRKAYFPDGMGLPGMSPCLIKLVNCVK